MFTQKDPITGTSTSITLESFYSFQLADNQVTPFITFSSQFESTFSSQGAGRSFPYSKVSEIYQDKVSEESDSIYSSFANSSFWIYVAISALGFALIIGLGSIAYNQTQNRKMMSIFLLVGADRNELLGTYLVKSGFDCACALIFGFLITYFADKGTLFSEYFRPAPYVNDRLFWAGGLVILGIYCVLTLLKWISLKRITIATDLRKDEV